MTFPKRTFFLREERNRDTLLGLIKNLPLCGDKPMQVTVEPYKRPRKLDQNALLWKLLTEISEQLFIEGRQYAPETLHHYFKVQFLPEEFNDEECLADYRKWAYDPSGERVLIGSSTQLTVRGFSGYIEAITAFAANMGVEFHTREEK
jgi:hypothetical protein